MKEWALIAVVLIAMVIGYAVSFFDAVGWTYIITALVFITLPVVVKYDGRLREPWAKRTILVFGLIGATDVIARFAFRSERIGALSMLDLAFAYSTGVLLGILLVLVISGQLFGQPVEKQTVRGKL